MKTLVLVLLLFCFIENNNLEKVWPGGKEVLLTFTDFDFNFLQYYTYIYFALSLVLHKRDPRCTTTRMYHRNQSNVSLLECFFKNRSCTLTRIQIDLHGVSKQKIPFLNFF